MRKINLILNLLTAILVLGGTRASFAQGQAAEADIRSAVKKLRDLERGKVDAKKWDEEIAKTAKALHKIREAKGAKYHATITSLLEGELAGMPSLPAVSNEGRLRSAIRLERVHALMQTAGEDKNEAALPTLRKFFEKHQGRAEAEYAAEAIGRIGKTEDLDKFISILKHDPRAHISLAGFGKLIVGRLMKEINQKTLSDAERNSLIASLPQASSKDNLPEYAALLEHKNRRVARAAAQAMTPHLRASDEAIISQMLKSKNGDVRFAALNAIAKTAWDERFIPVIKDLLKKDPDSGIRTLAAVTLGRFKVIAAEPDLKEALKDSSPNVRENAEFSLRKIRGAP